MDDNTPTEANDAEAPVSAISKSEVLLNMESMIKTHIASIDKFQEEYRKHKEMLDDIFANDPTYQDHLKKANEASKVKNETKKQVLRQPQAADLDKKVRDLKAEIKETEASLSDYLQEYARMSGTNEIEGEDGEVREIVYSAKLVRRAFKP